MKRILILILTSTLCSCTSSLFEPIGTNTSSPISVAVNTTTNRAYLINSNERLKYEDATLMVLDITDPTAPSLLSTVAIPNFSAETYLDAASNELYVTNRLSENSRDLVDQILQVDVSSDTPSVATYNTGSNPYGIACCDSSGRFVVATYGGDFYRYTTADLSSSTSISFESTLSTGELVRGVGANSVALIGQQAFVTTRAGEIFVVNLDELGVNTNPIDYIITSSEDLRGIATNGTYLYVASAAATAPSLLIVNPATLIAVDGETSDDVALADVTKTTLTLTEDDDPNTVLYYATLNQVYVAKTGADTVAVLDPVSETITATLTLGSGSFTADQPFGLTAFNVGGTDYLYVSNLGSDNVSIVNLTTQEIVANFP